jgi:hypothetical protein
MVTAAVGVAAGFIMTQMRLSETTLVIPRIRSEMLTAESAFRNMAYMNIVYNCNSNVGASSCTVVAATANSYLRAFESILPNCTPGPCGVQFDIGGAKFTYTTDAVTIPGTTLYRLNTRIVYSGTGVSGKSISVSPVDLSIVIPEHILTGAPFRCASINANTPFFIGYGTNGNPICRGWLGANSAGGRCSRGYYLKSFNADSMTLDCEPLSNPTAACGVGQFIGNVDWSTGGSLEMPCVARPNAFTYFGLVPPAPTFF